MSSSDFRDEGSDRIAINKLLLNSVSRLHGSRPYISDLTVHTSQDDGDYPELACQDVTNTSGRDCNEGCGGKYAYVVKTYTDDKAQAITGVSILFSEREERHVGSNLAEGTAGDFIYVVGERDPNCNAKVCDVALWRTKDKRVWLEDVQKAGWDGITADVNEKRGGTYLYLVWKTVTT